MKRMLLVLLGVGLFLGAGRAVAAEVIITEQLVLDPPVLRVTAGARVGFVNRTQRNVHVEFGTDPRQHEVTQIPVTGPIFAVFHRPGTHPFVVHVWKDRMPVTLAGVVEVVEDVKQPWKSSTCGVVIEGKCLER